MRIAAALGLLLLAIASGCGGEDRAPLPPPPPPSARDLARLRADAPFPAYWLGPAYGGRRLATAALSRSPRQSVDLSYGEASCSPAVRGGCFYDLDVATSPDRRVETEDPVTGERFPICWRRAGRALVLGCPDGQPQEVDVFTGAVRVYVYLESGSALRAARALRPMTPGRHAGLRAPRPFSCEEMRRVSERLRKSLPQRLRRGCPRA